MYALCCLIQQNGGEQYWINVALLSETKGGGKKHFIFM